MTIEFCNNNYDVGMWLLYNITIVPVNITIINIKEHTAI